MQLHLYMLSWIFCPFSHATNHVHKSQKAYWLFDRMREVYHIQHTCLPQLSALSDVCLLLPLVWAPFVLERS